MARLTALRRQVTRARRIPSALSPLGAPVGEPKAKAAREAVKRAADKAGVTLYLGPDEVTITATDTASGVTLGIFRY